MKNKVIAVVGATASGKSAYAVELAKKINGEIVSADSRLVYKYMDTGTAKPSLEERQGIKHHMIDVVEPDFDYSAGLYEKEAKRCIDDIISRGKVPIVAGGTGLYYNVLFKGYVLPKVKPDVNLRKHLETMSFDELYKILKDIDPEGANSVERNDKKKIIRYTEIVKTTGMPLKAVFKHKECSYDVEWIGLNYPRDVLYDRINRRVDAMIAAGLVDETENLLSKYGRIPNITDTIGYKEIIWALDGKMTFDEAAEKLKQNSRNYAKRQLTWFRRNPEINWNCYPDKLKK